MYRLILKPQANGEVHDAYEAIQAAIAIDTPIEIISNLPWHLTHRVAEHYNDGRIFFVGDSAHTLSPSGGFGMNTGIADAVDLGWKLAATLNGWASPQLLDTYEAERKPIAVRNLEAANANLKRAQKRTIAPTIVSDFPEGEQIRQQMAEGMKRSNVKQEFDAPEIHFGFRYSSPAIAVEGKPPSDDPQQWKQSSYPGCRAPHAWLEYRPDLLDIQRQVNKHCGFGGGIHFCLGSALARAEAQISLNILINRLPELRLIEGTVEWAENIVFHGPKHLRISLKN